LTALDFFAEEKYDNYVDDAFVYEMTNALYRFSEIYNYESEHCKFLKRDEERPEFSVDLSSAFNS